LTLEEQLHKLGPH